MKRVRDIEFFEKSNQTCPVEEFLDSLQLKTKQKVLGVFELIETLPVIPKKFFQKLTGTSIWEIRIEYGSNIYRFLCFLYSHNIVVLTHGFQKKSQKTPSRELEMAKKYQREYLKRR